jgi:HAD superfamily hydrolase (TIGR01490 family)
MLAEAVPSAAPAGAGSALVFTPAAAEPRPGAWGLPPTATRIAFFDMDQTVLCSHSAYLYLRERWRQRLPTWREWLAFSLVSGIYSALNLPLFVMDGFHRLAGGDAASLRDLCASCYQDVLVQYLSPAAVERVRWHEQQGDVVVLLSAATQFGVEPVARHLGVFYRCTELEVAGVRLTGRTLGEVCYGRGKQRWAERIAREWAIRLDQCAFYSDSYSDRALMERVGRPVAANPDWRLRGLARRKGWEIVAFT